jgi:L,D-transpeptidase ErfK/SrfK
MRAYYYLNTKTVSTYPMGIGREGWDTPLGQSSVVFKEEHPAWHPPPSIRAEAAHKGHPLPLVIPAGSHNPLGHYAIHLGISGILVHGTTQPQSVGRRSSHGCMRMYAQDIKHLFELIPIGTPVYLIHEVHHGT